MKKAGMETRRIILGISGANGAILGIRLLEALQNTDIEIHLIMSKWAEKTAASEAEYTVEEVKTLVSVAYTPGDMATHISSGPLPTDGTIVCPCSMKALAAIVSGFSRNLIMRYADISLKGKRKLLLVSCETPLSAIHPENLFKLSRLDVKILPPCVGLYTKPRTIEEIVSHLTGKILDMLEIENHMYRRWGD